MVPALSLPAPIFWGAIAAWMPVPPSVMVFILCTALSYALLNYLISLRSWSETDATEDNEQIYDHVPGDVILLEKMA